MVKQKTSFVCQECGYISVKWLGKCPSCDSWNSLIEEFSSNEKYPSRNISSSKAQSVNKIETGIEQRINTNIEELNRVLGSGIVPGSLILVGGDPGIGKSTLLLQSAHKIAVSGHSVLYISGEESLKQLKIRANRLKVDSDNLLILIENQIEQIENHIENIMPEVVIIDSIQTMYFSQYPSSQGSIMQVKECTNILMKIAKSKNIAIIIVGHVTKQGEIAGPRVLEHMVDSVLYFEGERHHIYRILRTVKNRYGSTNEIGIFEMNENGLREVNNPSELFLSQRPLGVAGSSVTASIEGTRPVLVEIQALLSTTSFVSPRRIVTGIDQQRVLLIMAVLEKRVGLLLQNQDVYINVAGGIKILETGSDLSVAISIVSNFRNKIIDPYDVYIGEIGLTGEVRGVSRIEQRVLEAKKLGFKRIIIPEKNISGWNKPNDINVIAVQSVSDALDIAFGGKR